MREKSEDVQRVVERDDDRIPAIDPLAHRQFKKVTKALEIKPVTIIALEKYLGSGPIIKWVGPSAKSSPDPLQA